MILAGVIGAPVQAAAPSPDTLVRYLEVVADAHFSAPEADAIRGELADRMRTDPKTAAQLMDQAGVNLQRIAQRAQDPVWIERGRSKAREAIAAAEDDPIRRAVEAEDPTITYDRASHRLVTRHTIGLLVQGTQFVTHADGLPAPGADFAAQETELIRTGWAGIPDAQQQQLAGFPANWQAFQSVFRQMSPDHQAHYLQANRGDVQTPQQAANAIINMAQSAVPFYDREQTMASQALATHFGAAALRNSFDTLRTGLGN